MRHHVHAFTFLPLPLYSASVQCSRWVLHDLYPAPEFVVFACSKITHVLLTSHCPFRMCELSFAAVFGNWLLLVRLLLMLLFLLQSHDCCGDDKHAHDEVDDEQVHFDEVLHAFRNYSAWMALEISRRERHAAKLAPHHMAML